MAAPSAQLLDSPNSAKFASVVTPADGTTIPATRGLYVGGAGNVTVIMEGDQGSVLFSNVPAGTILPIRVVKVMSTGTTATLINALF